MHTKDLIHHFIQFKRPTPRFSSNRVSNPNVHFFLSWSIFLLVLCVFNSTLNAHVGKQKLCIFQYSTVVLLSHCCTTIKLMWTQPDVEAWSRFNIIQLSSIQFSLYSAKSQQQVASRCFVLWGKDSKITQRKPQQLNGLKGASAWWQWGGKIPF